MRETLFRARLDLDHAYEAIWSSPVEDDRIIGLSGRVETLRHELGDLIDDVLTGVVEVRRVESK